MPLRRRERASGRRPALSRDDLTFALELPILWVAARIVPERRWKALCYRLEALKARIGFFDPTRVVRTAQAVLGADDPWFDARSFAIASAAGRSEHHLQILRSRTRRGWDAKLALEGREHLDAAIAAGNGAVLWVAHFCFNALAAKMALARAGYRVHHVSRPEHGFSKSRLGIALFNGIRVGAELPWLAGRIIIDRDKPASVVRAAQRVLKGNDCVSVTAGAWEGQRLAAIDVLGGQLELAVGAPGIARLARAPLLPVFTVRGDDATIRVIIEPPLSIAADGDADAALADATRQFGVLIERYVRRYPSEWRDWKSLARVA